ncbi:HugZ family protein [Campylobacterota bacterium DY0563]
MLKDYIDKFKSTTISTLDENAAPFTSYAPFIKNKSKYYVYISSMAKHYHNLELNPLASLFFIEDESLCENIFGRKRVVLQCKVKKLKRDNEKFESLAKQFEDKHGSTMKMLKTMKDFSFFEFSPYYGEAIFGFGEAYNIGGENFDELIQRENQKGHNK